MFTISVQFENTIFKGAQTVTKNCETKRKQSTLSDADKFRPSELSALLLIIGINFVILFYQIKMDIKPVPK